MDQIWHFKSEHLSGEFGKGFATVIGSLIIGWLTKDWAVVALATIFKNKKRAISAEHWHTAFLQNGALKIESAKLKSIPFVRQYIGVVKYRKPGKSDVSHYAFAGQLSEGFFTATYKSEEEGINDYGAWMLKLSDDGTAMVGAYVWIVKDGEIGHDFYQWTETDLEGLNSPMTGTLDVQRVEQFLTSLPSYFKGSFGPAGIQGFAICKAIVRRISGAIMPYCETLSPICFIGLLAEESCAWPADLADLDRVNKSENDYLSVVGSLTRDDFPQIAVSAFNPSRIGNYANRVSRHGELAVSGSLSVL